MSKQENMKLVAAMNNKKFDDLGSTTVPITAANAKLTISNTQLVKNNKKFNRLRKKRK